MRARGSGGRLQPLREGGVGSGRGAGPLDERGQRGRAGSREQAGQQLVRRAAAAGRRTVQDRAAQQRVAEVHAAARSLEGAGGPGGGEQHLVELCGGQPRAGAGPQQQGGVRAGPVRLVLLRRRREQQQGAGVGGELAQVFGVGVQDALGAGQRIRQRGASGQLARGEAADEPGQQPRVPGGLAQEFAAYDGVDVSRGAGQPVQEGGGGVVVERAEAQRGESGEGGLVCRADHHRDPAARAEPAGGESEGGTRVGVPGVRVVHADQQRLFGAQVPQYAEEAARGDPGAQERVGRYGQGARRGAQERVQPAVGQSLFGGGRGGEQHGAAVASEVVGGGPAQQGGTAQAGRRGQHERSAVSVPQPPQQGFQDGEFTAAAVQPERTVHGRR